MYPQTDRIARPPQDRTKFRCMRALAVLANSTAPSENEVSMKYKVALKKSKEGYSVSCPGLPGCWSQGKTEDEALENIQYAIREYLEAAVKISRGAKVREVEVPA
jgi:predicted RNase H-like HicB family nuclease